MSTAVSLSCCICINVSQVRNTNREDVDNMCVLPLLKLASCGHSLCFSCAESIKMATKITCPMCRQINNRIRVYSINGNKVTAIDCVVSALRKLREAPTSLNAVDFARSMFENNVEASHSTSAIDNVDDVINLINDHEDESQTFTENEDEIVSQQLPSTTAIFQNIDQQIMENVYTMSILQTEITNEKKNLDELKDAKVQLLAEIDSLRQQHEQMRNQRNLTMIECNKAIIERNQVVTDKEKKKGV
ncbi:CG30 [Perigonia lusca single nucleopolyhedrovirus]|uniref:CG30 n=1 Tax=Perigonia lusca single nucleopolyhedrovirus TaxID=1675865 RepID=A0A0M3WR42_9ABAC|nr:CG30 [Perigonia lusca single nucleopolyhedrovirus]AKN80656.1 CG30 [Perigonia lusca single nucleopolyhedrovirus]